ncbi:MAG: peptidoglycan-binding domain-containing protein [Pseudomonadota bacterium]
MKRRLAITFAAVLAALPGAALSDDVALILGNDTYESYPASIQARQLSELARVLQRAGYFVQVSRNSRRDVRLDRAKAVWDRLANADRLFIVIGGHIVHSRGQTWLLHSDAEDVTGFTIGQDAIPVEPFLDLAANRPGEAVVIVADDPSRLALDFGIKDGAGPLEVPQGVTLVQGAPVDIARFVQDELLRPGQSIAQSAARASRSVEVSGYLPRGTGLVEDRVGGGSGSGSEADVWRHAEATNTIEAYRLYLELYPAGTFALEAGRRITELTLTPEDRARLVEEGLALTRDDRRAIQRALTLLGHETRGIDGLFGRNTRNAIQSWQRDQGLSATGYLNANQISRLETSAELRAEELRIEAERRRLEAEAADRDFWRRTGSDGTPEGFAGYLKRYPEGLFADEAREGLREVERQQRRLAQRAEREAWDRAVISGTEQSYVDYLRAYPNGRFKQEADLRLTRLRNPEVSQEVMARARREEATLELNQITRTLIERQLRALNLNPGRADGQFTDRTRRALRKFQRLNNQPPTGFVTRRTIVLLLASATQ